MPELTWKEAIIEVLGSSPEPMRCIDIAEEIAKRQLHELNTTPSYTVAGIITVNLGADGNRALFRRVARGLYTLADTAEGGQLESGSIPIGL